MRDYYDDLDSTIMATNETMNFQNQSRIELRSHRLFENLIKFSRIFKTLDSI